MSDKEQKHSPLPFIYAVDYDDNPIITDADGNNLAEIPHGFSGTSGSWSAYQGTDPEADFKLFVRAVNNFYPLLKAAKELIENSPYRACCYPHEKEHANCVGVALKKAIADAEK